MKIRMLSTVLILALLACLPAGFPGLAETVVGSQTPIHGASNNKLNNIYLAAEAISGTHLSYGETFSFNDVVGARTNARGYRSAANARGVSVTGGGVSQVATTLYLALLGMEDDIYFDELSTYGSRFKDNYISDGSLAVITDYSAGTDFRFTNYASDMLIDMWLGDSYLYCDITLLDSARAGSWYGDSQGSGNGWFDDDYAPRASEPSVTQTITARIPFDEWADTADNIRLAADSISDTVLAEGDVFSFNRVVGPRTEDYGYGSGTNGRGVRVTGGGVAQVASVIWLAVKEMDDIAILEKSTYGKKYNQYYVKNSSDAIVTDYKADTDFSFRYTGEGTITIYTYIDDDRLTCDVVRNR